MPPFPFVDKTKQANDIIIEQDNVIITEKSTVAELFNSHFIQAAIGVA